MPDASPVVAQVDQRTSLAARADLEVRTAVRAAIARASTARVRSMALHVRCIEAMSDATNLKQSASAARVILGQHRRRMQEAHLGLGKAPAVRAAPDVVAEVWSVGDRRAGTIVAFELVGVIGGREVQARSLAGTLTIDADLRRHAEILIDLGDRVGSAHDNRLASLVGNLGTVLATLVRACDHVSDCTMEIAGR